MKKISIISILGLLLVIAGCKSTDNSQTAPLKVSNEVDTVSYGFGYVFSKGALQQFDQAGVTLDSLNKELVIQGFADVLRGNDSLIDVNQMNGIIQAYVESAQEAKMAALTKPETDFLNANKLKPGVVETASGLQYEVLTQGTGPKPSGPTTVVKVHYHGTLKDGTVFDSSVERGQPASFGLNQVIKGWTEGVQLMNVGSKYRFYIPFGLGYGPQGRQPVIPPYATLVFEVELLEIVQ